MTTKIFTVILAVLLAGCAKSDKDDDKTPVEQKKKSNPAEPGGKPPNLNGGGNSGGGGDATGGDHEVETAFTTEELYDSGRKAILRFKRLDIEGGEFLSYTSWITPTYIWVKFKFNEPDENGAMREETRYLACHHHEGEPGLSCHNKTAEDANEPEELRNPQMGE